MKADDLVLTLFASSSPLTAILWGAAYYKQNKRKKELENLRTEQELQHEYRLDENTRNTLVQEAANLQEDREQRREEWWSNQIDLLRREIESERQLSNMRFRRLNQLEAWATQHVIWDRKAWSRIAEIDPGFEMPPELPDESRP